MKNSTLLMVGIVAVAMLSAGLALVPTTMQQANAQDTNFDFEQDQENRSVELLIVLTNA